jgi:hypothetical protein
MINDSFEMNKNKSISRQIRQNQILTKDKEKVYGKSLISSGVF